MEAYAEEGSAEAFRKIFAALSARIHRFHLRSTGNRALAEDLTQQTFLKLHVARRRYRAGWPLVPWIFTIARNVQRDQLRRQQRSREDLADESDNAPVATTGPVADPDPYLRERLEAALQRLPEGQREVIVLHKFSGLSMEEIAETLDIGVSAAKVRAFRGYAALRQLLGPELGEAFDPGQRRGVEP
jgi:RNA polymerase sigma-70 factor (ECF subfamily)